MSAIDLILTVLDPPGNCRVPPVLDHRGLNAQGGVPAHFDRHDSVRVWSPGEFLITSQCGGQPCIDACTGDHLLDQARVHAHRMDGRLHRIVSLCSPIPNQTRDVRRPDTRCTVSSFPSTRSGAWTTSVGVTRVWSSAKVVTRRFS